MRTAELYHALDQTSLATAAALAAALEERDLAADEEPAGIS
jgi:hypothetical protein